MKIRIGVGAASMKPDALSEIVTGLDDLGFDSLWLSEVLTGPVLDPVVGLAWAAASNPRLKVGTTMLLPGRNVLRLAKQLASLDVLCKGRLLVTLVPGLTYAPEREAIGVEPKQRAARPGHRGRDDRAASAIGRAHAGRPARSARAHRALHRRRLLQVRRASGRRARIVAGRARSRVRGGRRPANPTKPAPGTLWVRPGPGGGAGA